MLYCTESSRNFKQEISQYYDINSADSSTQVESLNIPDFQRRSGRDINNVCPALRRRGRLARGAFEALGLLVSKNPDRIP